MGSSSGRLRRRLCRRAEIGLDDRRDGQGWPVGDLLLTSVIRSRTIHYVLTMPEAVLRGERLTSFLARVAPFGCPAPGSLIRAYSLPDSPFPSILLKEHEDGAQGVGDAYRRFLARARVHWLAALQETGSGLCPALAWQAESGRRFLTSDEWAEALAEADVTLPGMADAYLGRGLLLLANPALSDSWPTMMSLGGVTKVRKITGREFPVWVDLPAHQPALLASPLLSRVERLLAEA
jgi:hypothetical protein